MSPWICAGCAVEQPVSERPPSVCPICADEREFVSPAGQRWTTLDELTAQGHRGSLTELEPRLVNLSVSPAVGIGQRALVVRTGQGNLLWDPNGYIDEDLAAAVAGIGGVAAVATSHPHMFGVQMEWSHRFGGVPVYVAGRDREWLQRDDPVVQLWDDQIEVLQGMTLYRIGGHFPGSAVAHFRGDDGRGVLLSGDTIAATPDEHWVSFMRSYPNKIPLSAAVVHSIATRVGRLEFDRLYDNVGGQVLADASQWVQRSADRYIKWVNGDYDHLA